FERAFQSTTVGPFRQPLPKLFFFDFVRRLPSANSFNLNHLAVSVKGRIRLFRLALPTTRPFERQP
ncbi:MAG TPA: hypothetical protein VGB15_04050, partial [Longimicrobium sp.]